MIPADMLEGIVERLTARFSPEKILLFGSQATGAAAWDSDVDLLVVAETDLDPRERYPAARRELSDFPYAFDIIVRTPAEYERQRSVLNHIVYFADKYGTIIYER